MHFSIPLDKDSQDHFASTWEEQKYNGTVMPQGFTEGPYFSQALKADLDDA